MAQAIGTRGTKRHLLLERAKQKPRRRHDGHHEAMRLYLRVISQLSDNYQLITSTSGNTSGGAKRSERWGE